MSIKTYSLKKDGNTELSENFKVREFACRDGSDKILIAGELVTALQKIREHFNKPIIITSAYRTEGHNKKVGGARQSRHLNGTAADIKVSGADPLTVALYAQSLNIGGIGLYSYQSGGFVHIDVRKGQSRWVQTFANSGYTEVSRIMPVIQKGINGQAVRVLQRKLNRLGYNCGAADGKCGARTERAVKAFQTAKSLKTDGICGKNTWNEISKGV